MKKIDPETHKEVFTMKKDFIFILLLICLILTISVQADDLADVKQNGVLRLGSAPEYAPFVFYDENGDMTGIDIALIEEIGRRMGVSVQTVDIAFDGLVDSLTIGQVDIIGRGMSITAERKELIDFSHIYYKGQAQFIAPASLVKPAAVDLSSFSGYKIGVQKATSFEKWIRDNLVTGGYCDLKNIYLYANAEDLVKALDRKNVDLIIIDQDVYESLYKNSGKYQVFYDGFLEENYAFGLEKGSTLTAVIDQHLSDMMKDGTAQKIADRFFLMDYSKNDQVISHPTPAPTAAPIPVIPTQPAPVSCINSMTFVSDVTITDGHQVSPGERFRKTWRIFNNGTCSWTPQYSFVYVSGDQMGGNNVAIPTTVVPGQTLDISVDLIAPTSSGTFKGYWQMRAPQGTNFGQTIWVKVRVPGSGPDPKPVYPTPTPQPYRQVSISSFYPDNYSNYQEFCVTAYWSTNNATGAEIYVDGRLVSSWSPANGSLRICDEILYAGRHEIQLHAVNDASDAWASFTFTTLEHPTGLIPPDDPDDGGYATGLLVP